MALCDISDWNRDCRSGITYNQGGLTASDLEAQRKRGQYIRNVDELADAIAKRIPSRDIYRS